MISKYFRTLYLLSRNISGRCIFYLEIFQDAVFMISKATELFIETLSTEAFSFTSKNKKKTIQKNDVDTAIETTEALAFLDGAMDD